MAIPEIPADLRQKFNLGDAEAFERIVELFAEFLKGMAFKRLGGWHDAEDCVQHVFMKLHEKPSKDREAIGNLEAYLTRAVIHRVCDTLSRRRSGQLTGDAPTQGLSPSEQLEKQEEWQQLDDFLASSLSPFQRQVCLLQRLDGLSQRDIANRLGCSRERIREVLRQIENRLQRFRDQFAV